MFASRRLWRRMYAMCIRPPFRVSRVRVELMGWLFVFFFCLAEVGWIASGRTCDGFDCSFAIFFLAWNPPYLPYFRNCCALLRIAALALGLVFPPFSGRRSAVMKCVIQACVILTAGIISEGRKGHSVTLWRRLGAAFFAFALCTFPGL